MRASPLALVAPVLALAAACGPNPLLKHDDHDRDQAAGKDEFALIRDAYGLQRPDDALASASETLTFEQVLSHLGHADGTFDQRYFYNGMYARGENAPVLLYVCGEWTCSAEEMVSVLGKRAQELGAHMVAFEHRFYGESQPFGHVSRNLPELDRLQIDEALADWSAIQDRITADKGLHGRWIVNGCSYGGTMAAFYHARYPQATVGAYASSAPIQATPRGFHLYDDYAFNGLTPACRADVAAATGYLHDLAQTAGGLASVKALFGYTTDGVRAEDVDSVLVTDVPEFVQYGQESTLCSAVAASPGDAAAKATALVGALRGLLGERFWDESLVGVTEAMPASSERYGNTWVYQTCAEAGWHYVTSLNRDHSTFPFALDMSYYQNACRRMFGDGIDAVRTRTVASFETQYRDGDVRNVLFLNGGKDPWSALSFTQTLSSERDVTSLVWDEGSHCEEMFHVPTGADDPAVPLQAAIDAKMHEWLAE